MGDRTPDTGVLEQDDPPAETSGVEGDQGAAAVDTDNGRSSGEPTTDPARVEAAEESEAGEQPEARGETEESEAPEGPRPPKRPADADDESPKTEDDEAEPPGDDSPEPTGATEATAEDDAPAPSGTAVGDDGTEPDEDTGPTPEDDDTEPDEDTEPTLDDDSPAADDNTQATATTDKATEPANDTTPTPEDDDTEPHPDTEPTPDNDNPAADDNTQATATTDKATEPANDTTPTPEDDDTEPHPDTEPTPDDDNPAADDNTQATATTDKATEPANDTTPTPENDDTEPHPDTEPTPDNDSPAADKAAAEDGGESGKGAGSSDEDGERGEASPTESSESTRTVMLRTPKDVAEADRTMALAVADLPRTEPPARPAAPQDSRPPASQPPASPIDLLAQLTNTPPPPNTAARTLLRRVKIWSPVVALLVLVVLVVQWVRPLPEPTLAVDASAASFTMSGGTFDMPWPEKGQAAVMVAGSGTIGTFGRQKPVPTASVAKIMTAYVILRGHPVERDEPGPTITVDSRTVEEGRSKDESRIDGMRVGQKFSLQDMLKMLMIPSGNNVARLLARWDTGAEDETAFVRKMNDAAKSLGMRNTTYTDPSGLDKGTVSTAVDQLRLAEAVMKFDSFRAVVALPDAEIPGVGRIYNNNKLITHDLSIRGIKTGSNTPAGGTLSWAAYKTVDGEDRLILGTMMDQHVTGPDPNGANSLELVLDNSGKVIRAVREALISATAVRKGQVVGHVDDGLGGRTPVVATRDLKVVGTPGQKLKLTFRRGDADLVSGMKAKTVIGELTVAGAAGAEEVPVALKSEFGEPSLGSRLTRIG